MRITFDALPVLDPLQEAENLQTLGLPAPDSFSRANSLLNPLGESPARGWFLLQRQTVDALDLNGLHAVVMGDDLGNQVSFYNLVITREPENVTPGAIGDPNACYLVEVADARWRCHNPYYSIPINKHYNVRAPAWGGNYYDSSLNGGSVWTWEGMVGDIWLHMLNQLGVNLTLPFSPHGTPENWRFVGVSAWQALCQVLHRVGCAVKCDLSAQADQYSIVKVGLTDAVSDGLIAGFAGQGRKILDREFQTIVRGKVPYGVRVFFHRQDEHYGTERTTNKDSKQWSTKPVHTVDVIGPDSATAEVLYHPLWDDLTALFDPVTNTILAASSTACTARAQERSDDFFRMLRGGNGFPEDGTRMHKVFSGLCNIMPGRTVKGVSWHQWPDGGLVTEIVRHPWRMLRADDAGNWREEDWASTSMQPPDFRPTWPVYPHLCQVVKIVNGTADGSKRYDALVQQLDPTGLAYGDEEQCWAIDMNLGTPTLTAGDRFPARLAGYNNARPIYEIVAGISGTSPVVSAVSCTAGALSVTTKTLTYKVGKITGLS